MGDPLIFPWAAEYLGSWTAYFAHINEREQHIQDVKTGNIGDEPLALNFLQKMHKSTANMPFPEKQRITQAMDSNEIITRSDNTSIALGSAFPYLPLLNPGVYKKSRSPDEALASGAISDPITSKQDQ